MTSSHLVPEQGYGIGSMAKKIGSFQQTQETESQFVKGPAEVFSMES